MMDLQKDKYIIVEVIPTHSDNEKGFIAQISALKLDGIKLEDRFDYRVDDKFIENEGNEIITNIKKHIAKQENIADKWNSVGKLEDAKTLVEYISILRDEFALRSKIVNIDLSDYEKTLSRIENHTTESKKAKRLKKCGHADNNHKEHSLNHNHESIENRKVQKHTARF